ncbi:MAG TPA: alpha-amylase family glycosyl hydrolase, partial [Spirochaetota bacterium]|nr:alpha-amylase family glycosyl hydrolase [Spirochaetota bacterium]
MFTDYSKILLSAFVFLIFLTSCNIGETTTTSTTLEATTTTLHRVTTTIVIDKWFNNLIEPSCDSKLSLSNKKEWYKEAIFYHIWVKGFSDSDGDGIGDIKGIINKLDYLNDGKSETTNDLNIDAIWLSPIFECSYKGSNMHGYDTTDFYKINPLFGTESDIENLLTEAHKRGIKVIFDFVPNHISSSHAWFVNAKNGLDKKEWFIWDKEPSTEWEAAWGGGNWRNVWAASSNGEYYYAAFSNSMPDINFANIDARSEIIKVLIYWLNKGFDGTRLDAIRYVFEDGPKKQADVKNTHLYLKELRKIVDKYDDLGSSKMMVGEVWTETEIIKDYYGNGKDELNMCFDFPFANIVYSAISSGNNGLLLLKNLFDYQKTNYPEGYHMANFLSNHDNVVSRPFSLYSGNIDKVNLSTSLLLLSEGTPFIYYGNEIGMAGISGNDINLRQPFLWDEVDKQKDNK